MNTQTSAAKVQVRKVPFNIPHLTGQELSYIAQAHLGKRLAGNGPFTNKCQQFFERRYGLPKALLTTSCTDALEMAAILCRLGPGDQVIMPSYTYVSTAIAFMRTGCDIVFADSQPGHPNIDASRLEELITPHTRAIVPMHYAGVPCDMDAIMDIANRHNLLVVADAAQAIDSQYRNLPVGSFGHMAAFSFHETKNIQCGEGGMLAINDPSLIERAEIVWEKGTDRVKYFRQQVPRYGWCDIGSSFLPPEHTAAALWAQLQSIDAIQRRRHSLWRRYSQQLEPLASQGHLRLPRIPAHLRHNAHTFYLELPDAATRFRLMRHLSDDGIKAATHYEALHLSAYYRSRYDGPPLANAERYSDTLLRLPLYYDLEHEAIDRIARSCTAFFGQLKQSRA